MSEPRGEAPKALRALLPVAGYAILAAVSVSDEALVFGEPPWQLPIIQTEAPPAIAMPGLILLLLLMHWYANENWAEVLEHSGRRDFEKSWREQILLCQWTAPVAGILMWGRSLTTREPLLTLMLALGLGAMFIVLLLVYRWFSARLRAALCVLAILVLGGTTHLANISEQRLGIGRFRNYAVISYSSQEGKAEKESLALLHEKIRLKAGGGGLCVREVEGEGPVTELALAGASQKLDLRLARLTGVDLSAKDLRHADFSGAQLIHVNLDDSLLLKASFRDAVLSFSSLRNAVACQADLRGADLRLADLTGADLGRSCFDGETRFAHSLMDGTRIENADSLVLVADLGKVLTAKRAKFSPVKDLEVREALRKKMAKAIAGPGSTLCTCEVFDEPCLSP